MQTSRKKQLAGIWGGPALLGLWASTANASVFWLFDPKGVMADTDLYYMIVDLLTMGAIVGVTALLVIWFMWRYHKGKNRGSYHPEWSHSSFLEVVVWGIPIIAVGFLAYFAVRGTFELNPYNPTILARDTQTAGKPVRVDVVATDWQWLFVYPQYHMAVANQLVLPEHRPVFFRLTSTSVTSGFFIPQLVGMIDAMPGMRTKDALESGHVGEYQGIASDYAGAGTSWMTFKTRIVSQENFIGWVHKVQSSPAVMTESGFNRFARPYINVHHRVVYFSQVPSGLFDRVLMEVMRGKTWPVPPQMTENMVAYIQKQSAEHRD